MTSLSISPLTLMRDAWTASRGHRLKLWFGALVYIALYLLVNTALVALLSVYVLKNANTAPHHDPLVGIFLRLIIPLTTGAITIPILAGLLKTAIGYARDEATLSLNKNILSARLDWLPLIGFWGLYFIYFLVIAVGLPHVTIALFSELKHLAVTSPLIHHLMLPLHILVAVLLAVLHFFNMGFLIVSICLTCDKHLPFKETFITSWQLILRNSFAVITTFTLIFAIVTLYLLGILYLMSSLMGYTLFIFIPVDSLFPGNPLFRYAIILLMLASTFWTIPYFLTLVGTLYKKTANP